MNEVQKKIADLSEAHRWLLLSWLAVHHPAAVLAGLTRSGAPVEGVPSVIKSIGGKVAMPETEEEAER